MKEKKQEIYQALYKICSEENLERAKPRSIQQKLKQQGIIIESSQKKQVCERYFKQVQEAIKQNWCLEYFLLEQEKKSKNRSRVIKEDEAERIQVYLNEFTQCGQNKFKNKKQLDQHLQKAFNLDVNLRQKSKTTFNYFKQYYVTKKQRGKTSSKYIEKQLQKLQDQQSLQEEQKNENTDDNNSQIKNQICNQGSFSAIVQDDSNLRQQKFHLDNNGNQQLISRLFNCKYNEQLQNGQQQQLISSQNSQQCLSKSLENQNEKQQQNEAQIEQYLLN
ncbi:hypothetical protein PPERSA_12050 [Pseudocohnilembus persalinus]|uniref:Uncharacterized protein n=1 Tax=Pseudocohnilembus persalinus TaxID=266149 RepID=A0A0V0R8X4_PSEPJ|nr:hypothetical protein PPERSA_12050 [Pseudocohnilembus persalinus]|eukprot:KRX10926.1 hypothetical protein PPERSA_12050 [Pseudocohnilembus persalinus]